MGRTEQSTLGNFDSFTETAHREMDQAAITLLGGVEEIHEESYTKDEEWMT